MQVYGVKTFQNWIMRYYIRKELSFVSGFRVERWQSGRMRPFRKRLSYESRIGGSNPPLSSSFRLMMGEGMLILHLASAGRPTGKKNAKAVRRSCLLRRSFNVGGLTKSESVDVRRKRN